MQPLEQDYRKYLGRYDAGWDAIRAARVKKQAELGLFGKPFQPCPRPDHIAAWDTLSAGRKQWEGRRMAAYAGLIDRVDQELGRIFADLKRAGEFDNTLIVFFSDNGACPFDRRQDQRSAEPYLPDTMWGDSTGWAWVRNSPFRFYKQNQFEGGIATPAIVHWPAGLKTTSGAWWSTLPRISWTCCRRSPIWPARVCPSSGPAANWSRCRESLWPRSSPANRSRCVRRFISFSAADRGLLDGDWKLVSFQSNPWELYNLAEDRTELHDLAAEKPEIRDRLVKSVAGDGRERSSRAGTFTRAGVRHRSAVCQSGVDRFQCRAR